MQCHFVTLWKREVPVYVARQSDLGLRTRVLPDRDVWIYGGASALNALAAIFDGIATNSGVALLERYSAEWADLVIFQGTATPLTFPDYRRLRQLLRRSPGGHAMRWEAQPETPEDWKDGEWKWGHQLTVRADGSGTRVRN